MNAAEAGTLICPKCQGTMRQYERSGVVVDQCQDCRGLFLDRGELERLIEAEDVHYGQQQQQPVRPATQPGYPGQGYPQGNQQPQQGGFLGSLFGGGEHGGYRRGHH